MYLNPQQAAARMGVSRTVIYALCQSKRLAHYRVGLPNSRGKILIDPNDLDAFLATCRQAGEAMPVAPPPAPAPPPPSAWKHVKLND